MAYIGNTVQTQGFAPAIDYFNGNGVTVTFTLSRPVASVAQLIVAIDNVIQNPSSSFTVAGNAITFTSAPLAGTNNIWVEYTSLITTYQGISQDPTVIGDIRATGGYLAEGDFGNSFVDGTLIDYVTGRGRLTVGELDDITFYHGGTSARSPMMDLYYAGGAKIYGTTALTIPVGTTGERPTGATGMIRYNTTDNVVETYNGTVWIAVGDQSVPYTVESLVIAGGGGGGSNYTVYDAGGGGGGAGGYRSSVVGESSGGGGPAESVITLTPRTVYTVTVGAGGAGAVTNVGGKGANGSNSVFASITSVGGGGGGTSANSSLPDQAAGASGGSGGGATTWQSTNRSGGSGTTNQGYSGGDTNFTGTDYAGSGGGGAGAVGAANINDAGGFGGAGVSSSINGTATTRAGGGGGGYRSGSGSNGGSGGGGAGGAGGNGTAGTVNTGGGGGGSAGTPSNGAAGGSGLVIIRYLGAQRGTGGTVTSSGGYTIHTFTTSGTYTA